MARATSPRARVSCNRASSTSETSLDQGDVESSKIFYQHPLHLSVSTCVLAFREQPRPLSVRCKHGGYEETCCEASREARCEASCEARCEARCEASCEARCEASCEARCEASGEARCEASCEARCEASREARCEASCEARCQASREARCQASREARCQATGREASREEGLVRPAGLNRTPPGHPGGVLRPAHRARPRLGRPSGGRWYHGAAPWLASASAARALFSAAGAS